LCCIENCGFQSADFGMQLHTGIPTDNSELFIPKILRLVIPRSVATRNLQLLSTCTGRLGRDLQSAISDVQCGSNKEPSGTIEQRLFRHYQKRWIVIPRSAATRNLLLVSTHNLQTWSRSSNLHSEIRILQFMRSGNPPSKATRSHPPASNLSLNPSPSSRHLKPVEDIHGTPVTPVTL
jgi:hypothetical protein